MPIGLPPPSIHAHDAQAGATPAPAAAPPAASGASASNAPPLSRSNMQRGARSHPSLRSAIAPARSAATNHAPALNAGFAAKFSKDAFQPIPNHIHMVWVGSEPGESQLKYVKNWAKMNPQADINIWTDSRQLTAYAENKEVARQLDQLFPDKREYQTEKLFRGLFDQLHASMSQHEAAPERASHQALSELNKELGKPEHAELKRQLKVGDVTLDNAPAIGRAYKNLSRKNDEKFLLAERLVLDQTVKGWDRAENSSAPVGLANGALSQMQHKLNQLVPSGKAKVRDLSDTQDMPVFTNRKAYQHGIIGRNGAYPEASDIARYEILHNFGGTYADIDLECTQALDKLTAHPQLMLVGLAAGKGEASGGATPYFANALLSSHAGSATVKAMVDAISVHHDTMQGNSYAGARYFDRPNKSTIESGGPNGLREQIDKAVRAANGEPVDARAHPQARAARVWDNDRPENAAFWSAVDSHIAFPPGLVNFETEEQQQSATKDMA